MANYIKTLNDTYPRTFSNLVISNSGQGTLKHNLEVYNNKLDDNIMNVQIMDGILTPKPIFYDPIFANNSWETIFDAADKGIAQDIWNTDGDCYKDVTLNNGEVYTLEIMGFNHDELADGTGYANMTIGMQHLLNQTRAMNSTVTNEGSFVGSEMYDWLEGEFYNNLPDVFKQHIKTVNKITGNGGGSSSGTRTDAMKIFLFSEQEVFGSKTHSVGNEGNKYSRFTTSSTRIKKLSNGSGSASRWWLRSPYSGNNSYFCCVDSDGTADRLNAVNSFGVCAGFCV